MKKNKLKELVADRAVSKSKLDENGCIIDDPRKKILDLFYLSVFNDGTIGLSDGVGYVDTLSREDAELLYEALKSMFEEKEIT
jgi:hypothetical protein